MKSSFFGKVMFFNWERIVARTLWILAICAHVVITLYVAITVIDLFPFRDLWKGIWLIVILLSINGTIGSAVEEVPCYREFGMELFMKRLRYLNPLCALTVYPILVVLLFGKIGYLAVAKIVSMFRNTACKEI